MAVLNRQDADAAFFGMDAAPRFISKGCNCDSYERKRAFFRVLGWFSLN
jgi:hypothetical protein